MPKDLILRHVMTFVCMTALPLALCTTFAQAQDTAPAGHTTGSPKASPGDDLPILELPQDIARVPTPSVAPPVNRKNPATVHVELEARPETALIADGVAYKFWTYNGTVPGPMLRVRQCDNVELTLKNSIESPFSHSIDSHGVIEPGGGGKVTQTPPGATSIFRFTAMHPGVFIYHCATPMIPYHLAHGMCRRQKSVCVS